MRRKVISSELEKCHFMVKRGIVLGHVVSKDGIEDDKAKNRPYLNFSTS